VAPDLERLLLGVKAIARRAGVELQRFNAINSLDAQRCGLLRVHGIDLVFDVGANAGQYASQLRRLGYRGRIVSFEPLVSAFSHLKRAAAGDRLWDCRRLALGDRNGEAVLHVAGNSWSSSLLEMAAEHERVAPASRYVAEETVALARLDTIAAETGLTAQTRALLKLDLQGGELQALVGADGSLANVDLLEAELSLVELYHGQTLWREFIEEADKRGFELIGAAATLVDPESVRLLQMDALFARPSSQRSGSGRQ
jgi:FkbM family methyltransferase